MPIVVTEFALMLIFSVIFSTSPFSTPNPIRGSKSPSYSETPATLHLVEELEFS